MTRTMITEFTRINSRINYVKNLKSFFGFSCIKAKVSDDIIVGY